MINKIKLTYPSIPIFLQLSKIHIILFIHLVKFQFTLFILTKIYREDTQMKKAIQSKMQILYIMKINNLKYSNISFLYKDLEIVFHWKYGIHYLIEK